jgi:hypothetical protein
VVILALWNSSLIRRSKVGLRGSSLASPRRAPHDHAPIGRADLLTTLAKSGDGVTRHSTHPGLDIPPKRSSPRRRCKPKAGDHAGSAADPVLGKK